MRQGHTDGVDRSCIVENEIETATVVHDCPDAQDGDVHLVLRRFEVVEGRRRSASARKRLLPADFS